MPQECLLPLNSWYYRNDNYKEVIKEIEKKYHIVFNEYDFKMEIV